MKKYILVVAVVMLVVAMAGSVWAAGTTTQNVIATATVQGLCKNGTDGTLTFAPIDPSGGANVTASSLGLTYSCSNGTTFNITGLTDSSGSGTCAAFNGVMTDGGGHTLNYALTCASGPHTGLGFTNPVSIVLNGTITPVQFQNAFAATYTDTVTITVAY